VASPANIDGTPPHRKSHCHPAKWQKPDMFFKIQPEMGDTTTTRRVALQTHPPVLACSLLAAYGRAATPRR